MPTDAASVCSPRTAQHLAQELEEAMRDCALPLGVGCGEFQQHGDGWKSESLEALAHKAMVSGQRGGRVSRGSEAAPFTATLLDKDKLHERLGALNRACAAVDEKAAREAAAEVLQQMQRVSVKAAGEGEIRRGFERLDCSASNSAFSTPRHKLAVPKLNLNALVGGQKVSPATSSTADSAGDGSTKHRGGDWLAPELSDERIFSSKARLKSPSLLGPVSPDAPASSTRDDNTESLCCIEPFVRAPSDGSTASEGSEPPAPIAIIYSHRPTVLQRAAQLDDEIRKRPLPWELHAVGAAQAVGAHWKSESLDALARKALVSGNGQKTNITPGFSTPRDSCSDIDVGPEFSLQSSICGYDQTDVDGVAPCEVVLPLGQESAGITAALSSSAGSRTEAAASPIWKHNATPQLPGIMTLLEGNSLRYLVSGDKRRIKVAHANFLFLSLFVALSACAQ
jgi:hypothetical protein